MGAAVGLKTVTSAVISPPMSPTNMKGWGRALPFHTRAAAAVTMQQARCPSC